MKPIRLERPPCEIRVERGLLSKAGVLLSPPDGGSRRFLWICDLPDADPAPSLLLASLARAGHAVVRASDAPDGVDAILAVGDAGTLGAAIRFADERGPGLPCALIPTTFRAQLDFPLGRGVALVLCDPSLPVSESDRRRGVVELLRYAVGFDRSLFDLLYTDFDRAALIIRCLSIRRDLIAAGKTDLFYRLGAPIGLAISDVLNEPDGAFDEADALSVGLAAATRYALKAGCCRQDFLSDLVGLLTYHGLPNSALITDEELLAALDADRQAGGGITLSLPRRLGECELCEVKTESLTGLFPA